MVEERSHGGPPGRPASNEDAGLRGVLAEASRLARRGKLEQARSAIEARLRSSGAGAPELLDLLARIYAQAGYYARAENAWREAQRLDPDNKTYQQGLAALQRPASGWGITRVALLGLSAIVLALGVAWSARHARRVDQRLAELAASLERLGGEQRELATSTERSAAGVGGEVSRLEAQLVDSMGQWSERSEQGLARLEQQLVELDRSRLAGETALAERWGAELERWRTNAAEAEGAREARNEERLGQLAASLTRLDRELGARLVALGERLDGSLGRQALAAEASARNEAARAAQAAREAAALDAARRTLLEALRQELATLRAELRRVAERIPEPAPQPDEPPPDEPPVDPGQSG